MKRLLLILNTLVFCMCANAQINSNLYSLKESGDFAKIIDDKNIQIVDVRTPEEYKEGHIPNAKNIDIYSKDFDNMILDLNNKTPVAVYCRSGKRSLEASKKLINKGFKVYDLDGGILAWEGSIQK